MVKLVPTSKENKRRQVLYAKAKVKTGFSNISEDIFLLEFSEVELKQALKCTSTKKKQAHISSTELIIHLGQKL